jgi:hypothetical protein
LLDPQHKYNIFRQDRSDSRGGGVCVFVAKHLNCVEIELKVPIKDVEFVFFDILLVKRISALFIAGQFVVKLAQQLLVS